MEDKQAEQVDHNKQQGSLELADAKHPDAKDAAAAAARLLVRLHEKRRGDSQEGVDGS